MLLGHFTRSSVNRNRSDEASRLSLDVLSRRLIIIIIDRFNPVKNVHI